MKTIIKIGLLGIGIIVIGLIIMISSSETTQEKVISYDNGIPNSESIGAVIGKGSIEGRRVRFSLPDEQEKTQWLVKSVEVYWMKNPQPLEFKIGLRDAVTNEYKEDNITHIVPPNTSGYQKYDLSSLSFLTSNDFYVEFIHKSGSGGITFEVTPPKFGRSQLKNSASPNWEDWGDFDLLVRVSVQSYNKIGSGKIPGI